MGQCEETYGIFPCSTTVVGSVVLMLGYGYLLLQGANLLSDGSELLLEILSPGIIGGLVLPILGALPDALVIVVSGLGGSAGEAQEQVAVGVGTLAGSTIMLLTIAWAGSLLCARCDLNEQGRMKEKQLTHRFSLIKTGATTDKFTPFGAVMMIGSSFLYALIQVPAFLYHEDNSKAALWGGIACLLTLAAYCTYQVVSPKLQERAMQKARLTRWRMQAVKAVEGYMAPYSSLIREDGSVNFHVVRELFNIFDKDGNGAIDEGELRALLVGLSISSEDGDLDKDMHYWMRRFDVDNSGTITFNEFSRELAAWIQEKHTMSQDKRKQRTRSKGRSSMEGVQIDRTGSNSRSQGLLSNDPTEPDEEDDGDEDKDGDDAQSEEDTKEQPTYTQIMTKATIMLIAGAAVCAVISDPMVDAVSSFSKASKIPAFFVAFCVTPFASNASELVSSLKFALRRRKKNISLTYSQIYGAVLLNNTLCLGLFLLVVHAKHLRWSYTSEVFVTVGSTVLVGILGASKTTFRTFWALPVLAIWPLSIFLVYFGDYILKLDQ
ncbi:hypothetical protein WJX73_004608 [Symbiochloris irregularis]|uniref:EF-hand domain-containing protein n=1 Tax=Symbiochloris irregularis TaxID=706552 RepID=A0AAW1NPS1_9CHLO